MRKQFTLKKYNFALGNSGAKLQNVYIKLYIYLKK